MILINLNKGQFIKNYCHIGSNKKTWVSQNTIFTECFFSNYALINLDISFSYLKNAGLLLKRVYNKWGRVLLVIYSNLGINMNLMNVAFCAGWTGGLVSNFRCVRRSKRLHKINLSFPNAILNIPQVTYFEDRIFSEVLPYPIFYIAAKQLNEVLLSSNYFFVGNKTSYWSKKFYELLFIAIFKSFNIHIKKNFIMKFQKIKRIRSIIR